jgi:hypothetical protein
MIARRVLTVLGIAIAVASCALDDAEVHSVWRASPLPPPELVSNPVTLVMPITYMMPR